MFLGVGAGVLAALGFVFLEHRVAPTVLGAVSVLALLGALLHHWIGRDVYLLFMLVASVIGGVVSRVMVAVTYGVAIGGFGSLARLFGMDRMRRDFEACRAAPTMFVDAPESDAESFGRQS